MNVNPIKKKFKFLVILTSNDLHNIKAILASLSSQTKYTTKCIVLIYSNVEKTNIASIYQDTLNIKFLDSIKYDLDYLKDTLLEFISETDLIIYCNGNYTFSANFFESIYEASTTYVNNNIFIVKFINWARSKNENSNIVINGISRIAALDGVATIPLIRADNLIINEEINDFNEMLNLSCLTQLLNNRDIVYVKTTGLYKMRNKYFNSKIRVINRILHTKYNRESLSVTIFTMHITKKNYSNYKGKLYLILGSEKYLLDDEYNLSKINIHKYGCQIPYAKLMHQTVNTKPVIRFELLNNQRFTKPISYNFIDLNTGRGRVKDVKKLDNYESTVYFRQTVNNKVALTVRRPNISDDKKYQLKISLAYWVSILLHWKMIILLYEKESLKYEESASVLYERLIDLGYKNCYFVIDKNSPHLKNIKTKYQKNILFKNTFKHYLYFFIANTFIGTEMPVHAIDLRIAHKRAVRKITTRKIKYVFLQHGVMYMVSLASKARQANRKDSGALPKNTKIVVSSKLEAEHFVVDGGYNNSDLYITGLPKFDMTYKNKTAYKIVIMPTWRPWEYNQMRIAPQSTRYFIMLTQIINGIPKKYHKYIHLMPHPLFVRELQNSDLKKYIKDYLSYDEVLRDASLLVTDYSSVSCDAFYRGANVIFWWKEKDYCMKKYEGTLKINENNIFGDIVYDEKQLKVAVINNYGKKQKIKYKNRYKKIVEFNDGKNTDRLVDLLIKDKII
jgi:hypothetical protein